MSDTPPIQVRLFGPPEFRVNGAPLPRLKTRKGLHVLALLTLRHGREVARDWIAGTLWPETDERLALTYLRQSLTDLRRALGPSAAGRLVSPSIRTLRFDVDGAAVDADYVTFEKCLKRGDAASLEQAVELYRGPLLEGWAVEWLLSEREACQQAYLGALETLARQATESEGGEEGAAVRYLRLVVAADPLRESACRALLQALAATRDYAAVTQAYRDLRLALRREVNAEPDAETQALFARLRAAARGQAAAAARSGGVRRTRGDGDPGTANVVSLPRPLSEFIGRGREVEAARGALLAAARLVTLVGIGGVGKTRLAIRVAEEVADDFPDGVCFVDLSPVADPALVAAAAARALGVAEQPRRPPEETVGEYLSERHLLLVLDNCEHLSDACARFAAALLQQCPNVRILATSRQTLGVIGETVRPVPPMTLPDLKRWREDDKSAAAALLEYESVRLFVERAQRVRGANLSLDTRTLLAIAAVCERLDGIPLALELAAARTSVLGPEQIVARLGERLRLLSGRGGDPTAPDRQRTLRAALDWSYDLLPPEGRMLLCRASVFAGGWTLESAEAVCCAGGAAYCPADGGGTEERGVLDCLTSLADQSLVVVEPENGGRTRYRLLETVREYGRERLREQADDEAARLRARHRDYFLRLAREAVPNLGGLEQAEWLDLLEAEHDNLRAVLDGCLEEGTGEAVRTGLGLAGELQQFWVKRGHAGEGRARYAALLAADAREQPSPPSPERARALEGAGTLAYRQGDYAAAREVLDEALAIHRRRGDAGAEATPLALLGSIAYVQGDYAGARTLLDRALALRRAAGHRPGEASVLNSIGHVAVEEGEFAGALDLYTQALAISREVRDRALEASCLNSLGRLADFQDDFAGARPWFEQALDRNREIGDSAQVVINLFNLGNNSQSLGDPAAAEDYFREALLVSRELGESRSRRLIAFLLKGLAMTALARSVPERAALLLGASDALRESIGVPLNADDREEYDRFVADLRGALGEGRYAAKRHEGSAMRADQAVSLALRP